MRLDGWAWACLLVRWVLGLAFVMAGFTKVFEVGLLTYARDVFLAGYEDTWIPEWWLWTLGAAVPVVELMAGALLCLGLRTREALIILGCLLVMVTYGHLLEAPQAGLQARIWTRVVMVVFLLAAGRDRDRISIDWWLGFRRPA